MKKKIFVSLVVMGLISTTASAGLFGGKWNAQPSYYIDPASGYYSLVNDSARSWNSVLSSIGSSMKIMSNSSIMSATVAVNPEYYGATGWNATGTPGPNMYSGYYTYATVRINRSYMDYFTPNKIKAIITHELGHVMGLAHNTYTSPRTLMYEAGSSVYYDSWGISTPQSNDIADLNVLY